MIRHKRHNSSLTTICIVLALGGSARAEMQNVAAALDYIGYDLFGRHNPLSGGIDFLATNTFDGTPFDFGSADLSLLGPLSLQVNTGGRILSQFDLSFSTAVNGNTAATPLSYVFNSDSGFQSSQVSGTVFADVNFKINQLGFYDLSIVYSSRQSIESEGLLGDNSTTNDYDLGPIDISGNIYADILAILTAPFYDQSGQPNPFESLSGGSQLQKLLEASSGDAQGSLADGGYATDGAAFAKSQYALAKLGFGNDEIPRGNGFGRGNGNGGGNSNSNGGVVPEPAVLVLMLIGIPAIVLRTHRRKNQFIAS